MFFFFSTTFTERISELGEDFVFNYISPTVVMDYYKM